MGFLIPSAGLFPFIFATPLLTPNSNTLGGKVRSNAEAESLQ